MNNEEANELAENHWEYNRTLMELSDNKATEREHFLFVKAFIHGIKHERNSK